MFGPSKEARQAKKAAAAIALAMLERGELPNAARALVREVIVTRLRTTADNLADGYISSPARELRRLADMLDKFEGNTGD